MTSLMLLWASVVTADSGLAWQQTPHSLALVRDAQVVWQSNYRPDEGKPYFHPLTIGGGPTVTDLRPADHYWHRALWFSWKTINGLLYWEEDPQTGKAPGETQVVSVQATPRADHSARFELTLHYHPPGQPAVLTEQRTVTVSAPTPAGAYHLDWLSTFTAGDVAVLLDRTPIAGEPNGVSWGGYAGLSLRLAPELRAWQFSDRDGVVKEVTKQARWMAFSGPTENGGAAAIIVFEHPHSFRHPTPWYLIPGMPYFSPAILYRSPYTLPARQTLRLKYRIRLQPAALDAEAAEREWQAFAAEP
jgi:hypothetical protein